jgi:5-methylcytosine-specific restriction protein A
MSTASTGLLRPCLGCGTLVPTVKKNAGARCSSCENARKRSNPRTETPKPSSVRRGYDHAWRRLSREARRLHPFCMDCGTDADLTADHLRWPARSLADVEVVCRSCNSRRGAIRKNGNAISSRSPLHSYAASMHETWGVDPLGGSCDPQGGAPISVTHSKECDCSDEECIVVQGVDR